MNVAKESSPRSRVVLVVAERLPVNHAVNAAAVLGLSIGATTTPGLGAEGTDASGRDYPGIVTTPVPVLIASASELEHLFRAGTESPDVTVAALTEVARRARDYDAYLDELARTTCADADLCALVLAGPCSQITRLTKRLTLMGSDQA